MRVCRRERIGMRRLCDPVCVATGIVTDNVKLVLVLAVGRRKIQVENWLGVRLDHLDAEANKADSYCRDGVVVITEVNHFCHFNAREQADQYLGDRQICVESWCLSLIGGIVERSVD